MHTTINYTGDNNDHRAIIDLIRWFGLSKSKLIFRGFRAYKEDVHGINQLIITISIIGGVSGHPVRRLVAYCCGEEMLQKWQELYT